MSCVIIVATNIIETKKVKHIDKSRHTPLQLQDSKFEHTIESQNKIWCQINNLLLFRVCYRISKHER